MYPECQKNPLGTTLLPPTCFFFFFLISFGSLVNETLPDLKFNAFIITGFIFSDKYVKQAVLINHSWISPTLQKG